VPLPADARKVERKAEQDAGLSALTVGGVSELSLGSHNDYVQSLKARSPEFSLLCEKHGLDDPAKWTMLRQRFVLNLASLQGELIQAESMIAIEDRRSALNGDLISSEETRVRGRAQRERVAQQMETLRQMLRLMDEMEAVLAAVSEGHGLTGEMEFENLDGQSIRAQVLLVDGSDLMIQRGADGFFRLPIKLLHESTRRAVIEAMVTQWTALPELAADDALNADDYGELVAYDTDFLYFRQGAGGLEYERRPDSYFSFVPYEEQLEKLRESASGNSKRRRSAVPDAVAVVEQAQALNASRLSTIGWYEERLGLVLITVEPESSESE